MAGNRTLPGSSASALTNAPKAASADEKELAFQRSLGVRNLMHASGRDETTVLTAIELEAQEAGMSLKQYMDEVTGAGLTKG